MLKKIKFQNKAGFKRYLKNTSWLIGEKVLRILFALTIGVWVTRYLGPENFGILSYAQSFSGIFIAFSSLGLNDLLVRELVKHPEKSNVLLGTSFVLQTLGSTFIMICLITAITVNPNDPLTDKIIIILGLITFLGSFQVISSLFFSEVKSNYVVLPMFGSLLLSAVIKVILILSNASLIAFVYLLAFDVAMIALGVIYFYYKAGYSILNWRFSKHLALELLKDAWPLVLSGIVVSIYMKIDQVMIKEFIDNSAVGYYAAAVRLSEAWYFVPTIICSSLFPAIINAKLKSETLYYSRLQRLFDLMVVLGLSIVIPVTFLSDFMVNLLYGSAFSEAATVLSIHIWGGIFVFLGVANQKWFISENLQAYNIICLGIGMFVNVILNYFLIPEYGIKGAAYATLGSQFIASVLSPLFFKKTRPSFWRMLRSLFLISLFQRKVA